MEDGIISGANPASSPIADVLDALREVLDEHDGLAHFTAEPSSKKPTTLPFRRSASTAVEAALDASGTALRSVVAVVAELPSSSEPGMSDYHVGVFSPDETVAGMLAGEPCFTSPWTGDPAPSGKYLVPLPMSSLGAFSADFMDYARKTFRDDGDIARSMSDRIEEFALLRERDGVQLGSVVGWRERDGKAIVECYKVEDSEVSARMLAEQNLAGTFFDMGKGEFVDLEPIEDRDSWQDAVHHRWDELIGRSDAPDWLYEEHLERGYLKGLFDEDFFRMMLERAALPESELLAFSDRLDGLDRARDYGSTAGLCESHLFSNLDKVAGGRSREVRLREAFYCGMAQMAGCLTPATRLAFAERIANRYLLDAGMPMNSNLLEAVGRLLTAARVRDWDGAGALVELAADDLRRRFEDDARYEEGLRRGGEPDRLRNGSPYLGADTLSYGLEGIAHAALPGSFDSFPFEFLSRGVRNRILFSRGVGMDGSRAWIGRLDELHARGKHPVDAYDADMIEALAAFMKNCIVESNPVGAAKTFDVDRVAASCSTVEEFKAKSKLVGLVPVEDIVA